MKQEDNTSQVQKMIINTGIAIFFWLLGSLLVMVRHWLTIRMDRTIQRKNTPNFLQYFLNDIKEPPSILLIEPIFEKFTTEELNKLKYKINVLTFLCYFFLLLGLILYALANPL